MPTKPTGTLETGGASLGRLHRFLTLWERAGESKLDSADSTSEDYKRVGAALGCPRRRIACTERIGPRDNTAQVDIATAHWDSPNDFSV